ncbi:nuclear transport factor 2 family protein [soil metagenome]
MKHPDARLVRDLYEARARNDLDSVRTMLAEDVVWHEPDQDNPHTGDLHGPDAVLGMIREAQRLTDGTFRIAPREVMAHGQHVIALIDWSAERDDKKIEGKEVAVYRVRDGRVAEASFHLDDPAMDEAFWE